MKSPEILAASESKPLKGHLLPRVSESRFAIFLFLDTFHNQKILSFGDQCQNAGQNLGDLVQTKSVQSKSGET